MPQAMFVNNPRQKTRQLPFQTPMPLLNIMGDAKLGKLSSRHKTIKRGGE
jgi:hypothetical protein